MQGIIDAFFLQLNGVIYFNEEIREDRASATQRLKQVSNPFGIFLVSFLSTDRDIPVTKALLEL